MLKVGQVVEFNYTNERGENSDRLVQVKDLEQNGSLVKACDLSVDDFRSFHKNRMKDVKVVVDENEGYVDREEFAAEHLKNPDSLDGEQLASLYNTLTGENHKKIKYDVDHDFIIFDQPNDKSSIQIDVQVV